MHVLLPYFSFLQIHIIDGDSLVQHPLQELKKIEQFLQLGAFYEERQFHFNPQKKFYCFKANVNADLNCLRKKKGHHYPELDHALRNKLVEYFKPHNERLFTIVGQRFDWNK